MYKNSGGFYTRKLAALTPAAGGVDTFAAAFGIIYRRAAVGAGCELAFESLIVIEGHLVNSQTSFLRCRLWVI